MTQQHFLFLSGGASHVGKVRTINEDRYVARPDIGVWAVADGMGGHDAGEVASGMLADRLEQLAPSHSAPELLAHFEQCIIDVNEALRDLSRHKQNGVIGTTVSALLVHGPYFACLWSGDSRVYLMRGGRLRQLSRDHTEAQELVEQGVLTPDEALTWPRRNVVTRAIGVFDQPELDLENGVVEPGDRFLLCSDGLTGHVGDQEIEIMVASPSTPQEICDRLVRLTLDRGAKDNVTVVMLTCLPLSGGFGSAPAGIG